jgi:serine protease Do
MTKCDVMATYGGLLVSCLLLGGCVTTQGGGIPSLSLPQLQPLNLGVSDLTDAFSPQLRELKKLVAERKFTEADVLFNKEEAYFVKRFPQPEALPAELKVLSDTIWTARYDVKVQDAFARVDAIKTVGDSKSWPAATGALEAATRARDAIDSDRLMQLTNKGAQEREALNRQIQRVVGLAKASKQGAIASTFEATASEGKHVADYVGAETITPSDYGASDAFQSLALQKISASPDRAAYFKHARVLGAYLSPATKTAVDTAFAELVRKELMADGQITLDEVSSLGNIKTPFGEGSEGLGKLVAIGYVDLTSSSFKDRNVFDFQISFKQDMAIGFAPATESVFTSADISRFDYVFVTDLSVAKVSRQFKDKKEAQSRVKTGSREVQNPEYVGAMSQYQQSMAEFQRAQISSAMPKYCQGWGCALQALGDGLSQGVARSNVDRASANLARTSQTLSEPVYSAYAYQSVDINTTRSADVGYYVIDVKNKRILKSSFQINDNEIFNVAYNVRDEDPDKSSILRNVKTEDEVAAWEKKPMTVNMSTLFSPENIRSASASPYKDLQSFLKTISTRTYASAAPTFTQGQSKEPSAARATGNTIADERFDSIVILKNAKAIGTGFYVTPDLILTAYHVVQGGALVEMTYYDGTKSYGKVIDHDIRLDLALVKAQTAGKPLKIHSGPIRLGETVEAIGHPKGYEFTITRGVISSVRKQRSVAIGSDNLVEFVQTDTPISQGNSGGPLLLKDTVIGVNDWIRVDKGSQNLNFSVSFNEIREYLGRFTGK